MSNKIEEDKRALKDSRKISNLYSHLKTWTFTSCHPFSVSWHFINKQDKLMILMRNIDETI